MKGKITTILTVCPLRLKPEDSSEMVSQIIFGEKAEVVDKHKGDWIKIRMENDGYEGWADAKQFIASDGDSDSVALSQELFHGIFSDAQSTWITLGAELPEYDGMTAKVDQHVFRFSGQAADPIHIVKNGESIEKVARKLLNVPYLWGGRTPSGIDCSGFSQLVFKCVGIKLLRDARDQAAQGSIVDFASAAQIGDLAFFCKLTDQISHVGIVLSDNKIIHASGKVRIDTLDHYGIFNDDLQQYTYRLKIIKRYL